MENNNDEKPFYYKSALILLSAALFILFLYLAQEIIIPLVFALFVAILLNPVVNFLTNKGLPRLISIIVSLFLTILFTGGFLSFIYLQVNMFTETYPALKTKYLVVHDEFIHFAAVKLNLSSYKITEWLNKQGVEMLSSASSSMGHTLLTVGNILVVIFLIPVYIFFILYYKSLLIEFIRKLFHVSHHKTVVEVLENTQVLIRSYLMGLLIEGAIVAVLNCVALLILGVEYAIILGITGAILNVIPYIGGIMAIALPMIIAGVTKSWISALLVLVVYLVIQFIDNHYLIPYIVASKVKVNALMALIIVLVGNLIWGIPGMFLSIPILSLVKVIFDHIEPLKPYGFLLGDNIPSTIRLPFSRKK